MKKLDKRVLRDRRKQPTPALSRYSFFGRRRIFRRKIDQMKGGYVDRYGAALLFLLVLIVGLNVLDALLTMMILEDGGCEVNPVVRSVIQLYGDGFWVWKFGIVSVPLILLCLHSKFRMILTIILGISVLITTVVSYQVYLIICR